MIGLQTTYYLLCTSRLEVQDGFSTPQKQVKQVDGTLPSVSRIFESNFWRGTLW